MSTHLDAQQRRAMRNRLARARGQLDAVIRQLDQDEPCVAVMPQMIACNKAVDRATYAMLLAAIENCAASPRSDLEADKLRKLFLSLA